MAKYRIIQEGSLFYPQKKSFLFWDYISNIDFWLNKVESVYWHLYSPKVQSVCFSYGEAISVIEKDQYGKNNKERIIHNL